MKEEKYFDWSEQKNELLQKTRGVCFEEVVYILEESGYIDDVSHPNTEKYPNQRIFILEMEDYIYQVPYVEDDKKIFLKTIIPSRKTKKIYTNR